MRRSCDTSCISRFQRVRESGRVRNVRSDSMISFSVFGTTSVLYVNNRSGEFVESMRSTFKREDGSRADKIQTLWNSTIDVRHKRLNKNDENAQRARYGSTRGVVIEYLRSDESGV